MPLDGWMVPGLQSGTGKKQYNAIFELLKKFDILKYILNTQEFIHKF